MKIKLCFLVDANSIHARRWIEYFATRIEFDVFIVSTEYCAYNIENTKLLNLSKRINYGVIDAIGSSNTSEKSNSEKNNRFSLFKFIKGNYLYKKIRGSEIILDYYRLLSTLFLATRARKLILEIKPDIVHAMRLPIEGWVAGFLNDPKLVITTFGNDMIYYAEKYRLARAFTNNIMSKTKLYFADSERDRFISEIYGFQPSSLVQNTIVTGGIKIDEINKIVESFLPKDIAKRELDLDPEKTIVLSLRGFNNFYISTNSLIPAIGKILNKNPNTFFILKGDLNSSSYFKLVKLIKQYDVYEHIRLVDRLESTMLLKYINASDIMLSLTKYDGAPVSLIEGMALGLIPVFNNYTPIQEWIKDGKNGFLIDEMSPKNISDALNAAIDSLPRREEIISCNNLFVREKANYYVNMNLAASNYLKLIKK